MASEVLGTPGDKTALKSQGISGTDEVTETMQILEFPASRGLSRRGKNERKASSWETSAIREILEAQGIEKVQDMDEVMQIDESLTIPELEQVSMVGV